MKIYTLIPKNNKGCKWYMSADQLFTNDYVKVNDRNGFETVVDIRNYNIFK